MINMSSSGVIPTVAIHVGGDSMTKTEKVLNHLKTKGSITSWEAIKEYGATRLSAIIFCLRKKGYPIQSEPVLFTDRYGDSSKFTKYVLVQ